MPIPKPGKDSTDMNNYRGISLISCLGKIMERLVNKRLMYVTERNHIISNNQSGFRKMRSTTDNLVTLEHHIKRGFCENKDTIAVFFDLEKAYDMTWRIIIIKELTNAGIKGNLLKYLMNFLQKRTFRVTFGGETSQLKTLDNGIPQGSVLSCVLFNMTINKIISSIEEPVSALMYADDLAVYFSHKNTETIRFNIQNTLNKLTIVAKNYGFRFSKVKTEAVFFSRKHARRITQPALILEGFQLKYNDAYKFLGVILDRKLNFNDHIEYIKGKAKKSINLINMLSHTDFGSDRSMLLKIHKSLVIYKLDYSSFVFAGANKTSLEKLDKINRMGIRLSIGAFASTPIHR